MHIPLNTLLSALFPLVQSRPHLPTPCLTSPHPSPLVSSPSFLPSLLTSAQFPRLIPPSTMSSCTKCDLTPFHFYSTHITTETVRRPQRPMFEPPQCNSGRLWGPCRLINNGHPRRTQRVSLLPPLTCNARPHQH